MISLICKQYDIKNYTINDDGSIDVNGEVNLYKKGLTELPLTFNKVNGYFDCDNNNLTSLKGSPRWVGSSFYCNWNRLTSLEFDPEYVGSDFSCNNNNLTNINSHNVNSNNKTFNLQFFLNEQCKDALNIGEFVDSIKVQLTDLETVGHIGYVEGVSKILIKNLNELDVVKRPIHCSDLKREVLYIKDDDKWSKENDDKLVIKKAIKDVANKNIRQINEWTNLNPDCSKIQGIGSW